MTGLTYPQLDALSAPIEDADVLAVYRAANARLRQTTAGVLATYVGSVATNFTAGGTGAVARTSQNKARDWLHVLDFIPDAEQAAIVARTSTYDCSADLADCIAAATAQKKGIRFGGGRYRFLSDLVIPVGQGVAIDVTGDGKELTQIEFFGAGSTRGLVLDGVTGYKYGPTISNLTVFPNSGAARGVTLENLNQPKLENVNVLNAPSQGIYIDTVIMPRLSHLLLNGCGSASAGAIEIDNSTTAFFDEVYISGGEPAGGTGKLGGILIDRSVNFTMVGGAIESTGTQIVIASKSEGTIACAGGLIIGTDLENPGDLLPYIAVGAGWTGAAGDAATSWTFINAHGFPSGTTTSLYGVRLEDTTAFTFTNCELNQAGTPTSLYELVGTGNAGTVINPCRKMFGGTWPYVRVNGVQSVAAGPVVPWGQENLQPAASHKVISGATPSALLSAQGGFYSSFFVDNGSATNMTRLTDPVQGATVTLLASNGNTTLKHLAGGGTGQFFLTGAVDLPMAANTPYLFYCNPNNNNWYQV